MKTYRSKIDLADITIGSDDPDEVEVLFLSQDLIKKGYRKTSNAYCMVSRIDREDWLDVLAQERRCSRADFYNVDGSGVGDQHRDSYVRRHSKDTHTVHPAVLRKIPSY